MELKFFRRFDLTKERSHQEIHEMLSNVAHRQTNSQVSDMKVDNDDINQPNTYIHLT